MSSNGAWRAVLASRPQSVTLAGSAHCKSSMTRTTGRTALSSATSASSCSASVAGTSAPLSAAISPRSSPTIVLRRALTDGSRTWSASRNGSSGSAVPSSSPAPQKTWHPASGAAVTAACTSADLPMPGSPSISTAAPRPRAASLNSPSRRASSSSRPTSTAAAVTGDMAQTLLPAASPEQGNHFRTLIRRIPRLPLVTADPRTHSAVQFAWKFARHRVPTILSHR